MVDEASRELRELDAECADLIIEDEESTMAEPPVGERKHMSVSTAANPESLAEPIEVMVPLVGMGGPEDGFDDLLEAAVDDLGEHRTDAEIEDIERRLKNQAMVHESHPQRSYVKGRRQLLVQVYRDPHIRRA